MNEAERCATTVLVAGFDAGRPGGPQKLPGRRKAESYNQFLNFHLDFNLGDSN